MVFSSNIFLFCFLPLTIAVYFLLGRRFQNLWLLAVSLVFYAWGEVTFVAVMVLSILTNYGAGLLVDEVLGLKHFDPQEAVTRVKKLNEAVRPYIQGAFRHSDQTWYVFNMATLAEDPQFLQVAV